MSLSFCIGIRSWPWDASMPWVYRLVCCHVCFVWLLAFFFLLLLSGVLWEAGMGDSWAADVDRNARRIGWLHLHIC